MSCPSTTIIARRISSGLIKLPSARFTRASLIAFLITIFPSLSTSCVPNREILPTPPGVATRRNALPAFVFETKRRNSVNASSDNSANGPVSGTLTLLPK